MIFPAINCHLFWGFSMAMLNKQMVRLKKLHDIPGNGQKLGG
jgi:hypothetical protein